MEDDEEDVCLTVRGGTEIEEMVKEGVQGGGSWCWWWGLRGEGDVGLAVVVEDGGGDKVGFAGMGGRGCGREGCEVEQSLERSLVVAVGGCELGGYFEGAMGVHSEEGPGGGGGFRLRV